MGWFWSVFGLFLFWSVFGLILIDFDAEASGGFVSIQAAGEHTTQPHHTLFPSRFLRVFRVLSAADLSHSSAGGGGTRSVGTGGGEEDGDGGDHDLDLSAWTPIL